MMKAMNMTELEKVNGGGFFDFIEDTFETVADFVVDTAQNMKVPAMNVTEFIADGLCDKLADMLYDAMKKAKG